MLENIDIGALGAIIVIISGFLAGTKMVLSYNASGSKISKAKMREMEDYTLYLKKQIQVYKNKASNMERGPEIEGEIDELDSVLPNIFAEFKEYAPKWLKPFLGNPDMQKWLLEYAQKNPEKVQGMIGKVMSKKVGGNDNNQEQETTISV